MYKKILVPMALEHGIGLHALDLANCLLSDGGEIIALHVYEAPHGSVSTYLDKDAIQAAFEATRTRLEDRVKDQPGVKPVLIMGHTGRSIIDYVDENGVDCVVMGSHKPGLTDYFLGSTASRVVSHAACAVHVVRPSG